MARSSYHCPKCGNHVYVEGRNRTDADRRAAYALKEGKVCPNCYRAERKAEYEAEVRVAAETAEFGGLPEITAVSDRQRDYGIACRARALPKIDSAEALLVQHIPTGTLHTQLATVFAAALSVEDSALIAAHAPEWTEAVHLICHEMRAQTEAKYWIERADDAANPQAILRAITARPGLIPATMAAKGRANG